MTGLMKDKFFDKLVALSTKTYSCAVIQLCIGKICKIELIKQLKRKK